jgi:hypothetical protein
VKTFTNSVHFIPGRTSPRCAETDTCP